MSVKRCMDFQTKTKFEDLLNKKWLIIISNILCECFFFFYSFSIFLEWMIWVRSIFRRYFSSEIRLFLRWNVSAYKWSHHQHRWKTMNSVHQWWIAVMFWYSWIKTIIVTEMLTKNFNEKYLNYFSRHIIIIYKKYNNSILCWFKTTYLTWLCSANSLFKFFFWIHDVQMWIITFIVHWPFALKILS